MRFGRPCAAGPFRGKRFADGPKEPVGVAKGLEEVAGGDAGVDANVVAAEAVVGSDGYEGDVGLGVECAVLYSSA